MGESRMARFPSTEILNVKEKGNTIGPLGHGRATLPRLVAELYAGRAASESRRVSRGAAQRKPLSWNRSLIPPPPPE